MYDGVILNLWGTCNYGAILTAYAIQNLFKNKNLNYPLINYIPWHKNKYLGSIFEKFANKYLTLTHEINNSADFSGLNAYADTFVVGSDQVFRYKYIRRFLDIYTLAFTEFSKKRIALSASFGTDNFEAGYQKTYEFKKNIKRFDAVSTREISGVDLCKNTFDVNATHIIDPVFLIDKNKYIDEFIDTNFKDKYENKIVCYILDKNDEISLNIIKLKEKTGLDVIDILNPDISVEEWLSAIYYAKYVLTDSFHGSCFSMIFEKCFKCLINESRGSSRFATLCEIFENKYNFVTNLEDLCNIDDFQIETHLNSIYNVKLIQEKEKFNLWFNQVIDSPKQITNESIIHEMNFMNKKIFVPQLPILKKKFKDKIFSCKEELINNKKRKILTIFGIKIKWKVKNK